MALPSVMSSQDLAKFRTKLCERLLSSGSCHYGDRCQYSHDPSWPRRNPEKVRYTAQRCGAAMCSKGRACCLAHSEEEVLYHPLVYKEKPCPGPSSCLGFYCPYSHGEEHLQTEDATAVGPQGLEQTSTVDGLLETEPTPSVQGLEGKSTLEGLLETEHAPSAQGSSKAAEAPRKNPRHRAGRRHTKPKDYFHLASTPPRKGQALQQESEEDGEAPQWEASDRLSVAALVDSSGPELGREAGSALLGGRLLPGWLRRGSAQEPSLYKCTVKMLPVCREDRAAATVALAQVQRWAEMDRSRAKLFVVRKTKATICLALPSQPSTLDRSLAALGGGLAQHIERNWQLNFLAAEWVRQLVGEVAQLHQLGVGHLCISPRNVSVDANGQLLLGDFLGKARALHRRDPSGTFAPDPWWDMWYPAEALHASHDGTFNELRVDSWQLGVTVFYLLCGCHPFGDCRLDPEGVVHNIAQGHPQNLSLLSSLPVFADLVLRLTARDPQQRPLPETVLESHPAMWSLEQTTTFTLRLPEHVAMVGRQVDDPGLPMLRSLISHLPWAAALGARPKDMPPPPMALRAAEVLSVMATTGGDSWRGHKAEIDWHFEHLNGHTEDLPLYYEEASAWERWGRLATSPQQAVSSAQVAAEHPLPQAAGSVVAVAGEDFAHYYEAASAWDCWGHQPDTSAEPPPDAEAETAAVLEALVGDSPAYPALEEGGDMEMAGLGGWGPMPAFGGSLDGAGFGSHNALASVFLAADVGLESPPQLPALPGPDAEPEALARASRSPVRVRPLNMDNFKENCTPNRAMPGHFTKASCKGSGLPSGGSPAYVELEGTGSQRKPDFSKAGTEDSMDLASLPPAAFYAIMELRRRRLACGINGFTRDLRRVVAALAV